MGSAVGYCSSFSKRKTLLDSGFLAECINTIVISCCHASYVDRSPIILEINDAFVHKEHN
jgi:hypothetical protein